MRKFYVAQCYNQVFLDLPTCDTGENVIQMCAAVVESTLSITQNTVINNAIIECRIPSHSTDKYCITVAANIDLMVTNALITNTWNFTSGIHLDSGATLDLYNVEISHFDGLDSSAVEATNYNKINAVATLFKHNIIESGDGGAISVSNGSFQANWVVFLDNHSEDYGGAIYISDYGIVSITNSYFAYNSCPGDGGALWLNDGNLTIANSYFAYNAGGYGGAVSSYGTSTVIEDSTFEHNSALDGVGYGEGGAFYCGEGDCLLDNAIISHNVAEYVGGGIAHTGNTLTVRNSIFNNNIVNGSNDTFPSGGAGVYTSGNSAEFINVTFANNKATTFGGGAIFQDGTEVTLCEVVFSDNNASNSNGDDIFCYGTEGQLYLDHFSNSTLNGFSTYTSPSYKVCPALRYMRFCR